MEEYSGISACVLTQAVVFIQVLPMCSVAFWTKEMWIFVRGHDAKKPKTIYDA